MKTVPMDAMVDICAECGGEIVEQRGKHLTRIGEPFDVQDADGKTFWVIEVYLHDCRRDGVRGPGPVPLEIAQEPLESRTGSF